MIAAKELVYVRELLVDLRVEIASPSVILSDSKSAVDLAFDPVAFKKTKHILRASNELRDKMARDVFTPTYVEAAGQRADILTKPLGPTMHQQHLDTLLPETEGA